GGTADVSNGGAGRRARLSAVHRRLLPVVLAGAGAGEGPLRLRYDRRGAADLRGARTDAGGAADGVRILPAAASPRLVRTTLSDDRLHLRRRIDSRSGARLAGVLRAVGQPDSRVRAAI